LLSPDKAIISFTFDDVPKTAVKKGAKILNNYGIKGTFYLSLELLGGYSDVGLPIADRHDIENLISNGHEIGDHTYSHLRAFEVSDEEYEKSILMNREKMDALFAGYEFRSFAYPYGSVTPNKKRIVRKYYNIARGIEGGLNKSYMDTLLLKSYHLAGNKDRLGFYSGLIDNAIEQNSWLIFFTHEVQTNPTEFGCDLILFESLINYCISKDLIIKTISDLIE
jgi:peptidoglycan/xylan/chitin deacetylase (PgdA/CDA1 family)